MLIGIPIYEKVDLLDVAAPADDAASRFDPLSSQGITKALRSGVFASYAAGDQLATGDNNGLRRYDRFIHSEFLHYLRTRQEVYRDEQRWPRNQFWSERCSVENVHSQPTIEN